MFKRVDEDKGRKQRCYVSANIGYIDLKCESISKGLKRKINHISSVYHAASVPAAPENEKQFQVRFWQKKFLQWEPNRRA